jgi:hypothetical protein
LTECEAVALAARPVAARVGYLYGSNKGDLRADRTALVSARRTVQSAKSLQAYPSKVLVDNVR